MHKHKPQRGTLESFVVIQQVRGGIATEEALDQIPHRRPKLNLSVIKLFHRLRKFLMRIILRSSDSSHRNSDRFEPPKTSCSSYYSSYSHYNEAIADCIEFFNKSAQDDIFDGQKSDVV